MEHSEIPYPHPTACQDCRDAQVCDVCGAPAPRAKRCTNGRCLDCHAKVCTPGIAHGYGRALPEDPSTLDDWKPGSAAEERATFERETMERFEDEQRGKMGGYW